MRSIVPAIAITLVALAGPVVAQYQPGDTVFTGTITSSANLGQVLGIRPGGPVYTVKSIPGTFMPLAVQPTPDNQGLWVMGSSLQAGEVVHIASDGTITSLYRSFGFYPNGFEVDEGGTAVATDMFFSSVVSYTQLGVTTLYSGFRGGMNGGAIDLNTGDFIAYENVSGALYRLPLHGTPSTLRLENGPTAARDSGMHSDPLTGDMLVAVGNSILALQFGQPPVLTTLWSDVSTTLHLSRIDRDPLSETFLVAANFMAMPNPPNPTPSPTPYLFRFDPRTSAFTTIIKPGVAGVTAVAVAGSRHLSGVGYARIGTAFHLQVSVPAEPGNPYAVALSFSYKPGFVVQGRRIHLNVDPLLLLSLTNTGIFANFQGYLSTKGEAFPRIALPNLKGLQGQRFYAVAVTIGSGGFNVISEPLGVTIR